MKKRIVIKPPVYRAIDFDGFEGENGWMIGQPNNKKRSK